MSEISTAIIKDAVYKLCFLSNTCLQEGVYSKISEAYFSSENEVTKNLLKRILQNAKIAYEKKLPLCQDTGQVIVSLEIGQSVQLTGDYIEDAINSAVEECYRDNYFRKSIVENSIFNRTNTKTNTPAIIYTKIVKGDEINIKVLIKGAGSENKSKLEMMLPTTDEDEFVKKTGDMILSAGENACPPMFIGIGVGQSADGAMLLSKQALISEKYTDNEVKLADKIKKYVNENAPERYFGCYVLDVKLLSAATHIASLPVALTINCHSERYSECIIKDGQIIYKHKIPEYIELEDNDVFEEVLAEDIEKIKSLKNGDNILLTGEMFVARDMAHKKIFEMMSRSEEIPIQIRDKIILYAGPCPAKPNEIAGSIGPTTASRMDKYASELYKKGLLATIGKGDRSKEVYNTIEKTGAKYFVLQGGVAALLSQKIHKCEIVAFPELGAEAIYKIQVKRLPVSVALE